MYFCENPSSTFPSNNRNFLRYGLNGIVANMIKVLNYFLEPQITYNDVTVTDIKVFIFY